MSQLVSSFSSSGKMKLILMGAASNGQMLSRLPVRGRLSSLTSIRPLGNNFGRCAGPRPEHVRFFGQFMVKREISDVIRGLLRIS